MIVKSNKNRVFEFVFSLIIDHLFAFFGAMIITNITGFFATKDMSVLNFIICVALYSVILYSDAWKRGCNDRNRVSCGLSRRKPFYGFCVGLIASIPSFVLGILAFLSECGLVSVYSVFENVDICTTLNRLWQLPFSSIFSFVKHPIVNLFLPFFLPIVCGVGYAFGSYEIYIKNYVLYKHDDKE